MIKTGFPNVQKNGRIIAHRGASRVAPENTIAAFRKALEQGVDWVEFDVSLLGDNTPVIHHDDTLDRCTDGSGPLTGIGRKDLATIRAGKLHGAAFAKEKIPLLEAALDLFESTGMSANLEMKPHDGTPGTLAAMVHDALAKRIWAPERIIASSFDHDELAALRARMPEIPLAALWVEPPEDFRTVLTDLEAAAAHIHYPHLSQSLLQEATSYGFDVRVYTVNEVRVMAPFRELGLTSVITDHPPMFLDDSDWAEWNAT